MSEVEQVVASLIRSWREGRRQSFEGLSLDNETQAYEVQHRVAKALGWFVQAPARAWKLGGVPGGMISAAGVPTASIHPSGWRVPVGYCHGFGIEGELIVRLRRDLDEYTDRVLAYEAIDSWMPGIELCDTRWVRGDQASPLLRLADQQLNRALILGEPQKLAHLPDWSKQTAELRVSRLSCTSGTASHPFGDPLSSLPWLARHAAALGNPLRAGDLIATGSWTGIYWAPAGARVEVAFAGLGCVTLFT